MRTSLPSLPLHFSGRYLLRGYPDQIEALAQAAKKQDLPFASAEMPSGFSWCIATGQADADALNAHVASRKPLYERIQRQLVTLVEDGILEALTQPDPQAPPMRPAHRSLSDLPIPAVRLLDRIARLHLAEQSQALIQPDNPQLKPILDWITAHYGPIPNTYSLPSAYKAVQALAHQRFDLDAGRFTYDPISREAVLQTLYRDLFGHTEIKTCFGRRKQVATTPSLPKSEILQALARAFPAADPEALDNHVRQLYFDGLLSPVRAKGEGTVLAFNQTGAKAVQALAKPADTVLAAPPPETPAP